MFYMLKRKKKTYPVYVSKHDSNRKKQVILLMIPSGEGLFYFAGTKLSALQIRQNSIAKTPQQILLSELPSFLWNRKLT